MPRNLEMITNPMVKENDLLRLVLGICPALSITTVALHSLSVGIMLTIILLLTNFILSLLVARLPTSVHLPIYITLVAGFVTILEILMEAYLTPLYQGMGDFIPFLVIISMILGKISPSPVKATADALKMGLSFTVMVTILGILREITGAGTCFGKTILPEAVKPFTVMTSPPGGFLLFGILLAFLALFTREKELEKSLVEEIDEFKPMS